LGPILLCTLGWCGFHSLYDSIAIPAPIALLFHNVCIGPALMEEYARRAVFRLCEDWSVYSPLSRKFTVEMSSV